MHKNNIHVVGLGGTMRTNSTSLTVLERALKAAAGAGATTELLSLYELDLPMFRPGTSPEEYGPAARGIARLIDTARAADAMIWSTAGYHGTLAGVTKNALDFLEFLADEEKSYLQDKVIGLIATSGGTMAGANAVNNMVQVVHALRGTVAPLMVPIPQAWRNVDARSGEINDKWDKRLHKLGVLVVEMARALRPEALQDEPALARQGTVEG